MSPNTTWREEITEEMEKRGETWGDVEACTLDDKGLDVSFYPGYGGSKGKWFTLWTRARVYFPAVYDGSEWVESVPRNPCDEAKRHVGGE